MCCICPPSERTVPSETCCGRCPLHPSVCAFAMKEPLLQPAQRESSPQMPVATRVPVSFFGASVDGSTLPGDTCCPCCPLQPGVRVCDERTSAQTGAARILATETGGSTHSANLSTPARGFPHSSPVVPQAGGRRTLNRFFYLPRELTLKVLSRTQDLAFCAA